MKNKNCLMVNDELHRWRPYQEWLENKEGIKVRNCRTIREIVACLNKQKYDFGLISNSLFENTSDPFNAGVSDIAPLLEAYQVPYILLAVFRNKPNIAEKDFQYCLCANTLKNVAPWQLIPILKSHKLWQ